MDNGKPHGPVCDFDRLPFASLVITETGEKLYLCGLCWTNKYPLARLSEDEEEEAARSRDCGATSKRRPRARNC